MQYAYTSPFSHWPNFYWFSALIHRRVSFSVSLRCLSNSILNRFTIFAFLPFAVYEKLAGTYLSSRAKDHPEADWGLLKFFGASVLGSFCDNDGDIISLLPVSNVQADKKISVFFLTYMLQSLLLYAVSKRNIEVTRQRFGSLLLDKFQLYDDRCHRNLVLPQHWHLGANRYPYLPQILGNFSNLLLSIRRTEVMYRLIKLIHRTILHRSYSWVSQFAVASRLLIAVSLSCQFYPTLHCVSGSARLGFKFSRSVGSHSSHSAVCADRSILSHSMRCA